MNYEEKNGKISFCVSLFERKMFMYVNRALFLAVFIFFFSSAAKFSHLIFVFGIPRQNDCRGILRSDLICEIHRECKNLIHFDEIFVGRGRGGDVVLLSIFKFYLYMSRFVRLLFNCESKHHSWIKVLSAILFRILLKKNLFYENVST